VELNIQAHLIFTCFSVECTNLEIDFLLFILREKQKNGNLYCMKQCIICKVTEAPKWYSGPKCTKCYASDRYVKNKNLILASQNPEKKRSNARLRYKNKKKEILENAKKYYQTNKESILLIRKDYYEKNKREIIKNQVARDAIRIRTDIGFLLKTRVRSRFKMAMRGNYKTGVGIKYLGCSIEEFKNYIYNQFQPEMTWDNYGKEWELDHRIALLNFDLTKEEDLKIACNFTNIQPLWKEDHYKKTQRDRSKK